MDDDPRDCPVHDITQPANVQKIAGNIRFTATCQAEALDAPRPQLIDDATSEIASGSRDQHGTGDPVSTHA